MKTILRFLCLSLAAFTPLHADRGTNSERLGLLKALSFTNAKSVSIAKLSAPSPAQKPNFHGCLLTSDWQFLAGKSRDDMVALIQEILNHDIERLSKNLDADYIELQPFGFVHGDYGISVETAFGTREFSICLPRDKWSGYLYGYVGRKKSLGMTLGRETMQKFAAYQPK